MSAAAAGAGDRTRTVLHMAPPGPLRHAGPGNAERDDGVRWMKRFLNGEYDRWMLAKRMLNVQEDHVIVKVLLDFFLQSHGGLDATSLETVPASGSAVDRLPRERETPPSARPGETAPAASPQTDGPDCPPPFGDAPSPPSADESSGPATNGRLRPQNGRRGDTSSSPAEEESSRPSANGRLRLQNGRRGTLKKARAAEAAAVVARPAPDLPAVHPQLMPLFSCGLCGAGSFSNLAAHFEHLWSAHTELRMLGSAQRRRVPLKLRPHMFVLCALCGLNNRSTSTAGAADRHLTRAHLPARHQRHLQAAAAGPLRFACDECEAVCGSRAELAVHALDAEHDCPGFTCDACGEQGEGVANARHHRLWHRAAAPFQCYLCAERCATEPECVAHVRAEHAASFNVHRCTHCPYATSLVGQFIAHARSHVGLNACVCHECGVMFHTAQSLRRHLMTHARSEFPCPHCDKIFRHPLPLERHVRSQHVSPDDHKCGECGKLFTSRYHLERHALIHSGRRPHQCDKCGRGFVQKGDLARHVRRCRVGQDGEKPKVVKMERPTPSPPPHPLLSPMATVHVQPRSVTLPPMALPSVEPRPVLLPPPQPAISIRLPVPGTG